MIPQSILVMHRHGSVRVWNEVCERELIEDVLYISQYDGMVFCPDSLPDFITIEPKLEVYLCL